MTDAHWKDLGERALALCIGPSGVVDFSGVLPWEESRGILWRVSRCAEGGYRSWPDFRDPVTEAWLVASAQLWVWQYAPDKCEEDPGIPDGDSWQITIGDIVVQGESRAEAWILALEKLREET